MLLQKLDIMNFRNIADASLQFCDGVNCLLGNNGMGKSNLLESIHFLCMARPMGHFPESAVMRRGEEQMMLKGSFTMDSGGEESVSCGIVRGKGKTLKRNGKEYPRLSAHIGAFPIVAVTPADSELVSGSAEGRRRLADMVISQGQPAYLSQLIRYTKALDSRNKMLRAGVKDALLYESIESGMEEAAAEIHRYRREWTEWIAEPFRQYYSLITADAEQATLEYRSALNEASLHDILAAERGHDFALGFTSKGVHRDDLAAGLDGYSMRRQGSQGQVKSFVIALRLAIFDYLREKGGVRPILLLDDVFDKLDSTRVGRIMEVVSNRERFGQIFISDTNREHLDETLAGISGESLLLGVESGKFAPIAR